MTVPSRNPPAGWVRLPVEMPEEMRDNLKRLAIDRKTSVGKIMRELAAKELKEAGY